MTSSDLDERLESLETVLADPWDPANPTGFAEIVAADERQEVLRSGEQLLDDFGLRAELVPVAHGGRFTRADHLIELMRSVYRRDPCLGLGYGSGSLLTAVNVWTAGSIAQRGHLSRLLLANRTVACAYHELGHGNDIGGMEFSATPSGSGLRLNGRKEVVANLRRADAVVFFARTDPSPGPRSHSQLYVDMASVDHSRIRHLPRFGSVGMRGVELGGVEVADCEVGADALLGHAGTGMETTGKAFQLTRIALPAMSTAMLDTGLRATLTHVRSRILYGRSADSIPIVRTTLCNAFADQLACEAFALVAARALHVTPRAGSVYAPAVKFVVSGLLLEAMHQLTAVMGSEFYRRNGSHAIFQKMVRDLKPVSFGHMARAACLSSVIPQLPLLARRGWRASEPAPAELASVGALLPPLDFAGLSITAAGQDPLGSSLNTAVQRMDAGVPAPLRRLVDSHATSLRTLADACSTLSPAELSIGATTAVRGLASMYLTLLAASACVEVWRQHRASGGFLGRPEWIIAALTRLGAPNPRRARDVPFGVEGALFEELLGRHDRSISFGLSGRAYR